MVAKLGLDGADHSIELAVENGFVELRNHLARPERTQVAAVTAGRAGRVLLGDFCETLATFDGFLQFLTLGFTEGISLQRMPPKLCWTT